MRLRTLLTGGTMFVVAAAQVHAQDARAESRGPARARSFTWSSDDGDRPLIGVSTSSGGRRDTLGLLVTGVTPGGPAEKAGIEEGARLVAVNGVSLKLAPADAGEPDMAGVLTRRLSREIRKGKVGDDVELKVWQNGSTRTVRVKTVAAEDLRPERLSRADLDDRPVLGLSVGATGTRRDTLGVFVSRVAEGGPAEKAGIVEGDRIAAINGVDLRVARDDAGDDVMGSAKHARFTREMRKVKAGQDVELRVVSGGAARTVRVKAARNEDVYRDGDGWVGFGDGQAIVLPRMPRAPMAPMAPLAPRMRVFRDGDQAMLDDGDWSRLSDRLARLGPELQARLQSIGPEIGARMSELGPEIGERVREALERARVEVWQDDDDLDDDRDDDDRDAAAPAAAPRAPEAASPRALERRNEELSRRVRELEAQRTLQRARTASLDAPVAEAAGSAYVSTAAAIAPRARAAASGSFTVTGEGERFRLSLPGLRLSPVSSDLAQYLGAGSERGLLVLEADERWSGLRAGDVLLTVDGEPVSDGYRARLTMDLARSHALVVLRGGKRQAVELAGR